ncbi:aldehyde dehydrogenase family protein [Thioalkalivibrio thiocyanodenitrificans]|uniref:aldehyde dehydrogenase family protein n=1 Tax=Thioalkalivibrio thiocyanodenitrificans TaxID=243063 RepID=UPI0003649CE1|nr:aldehyde dehydrogenase family protein [Thioalkalivibrio thiocyanodenitrificans]
MKAALLLIDLQQDFLGRPDLLPMAEEVIAANARVLALARARRIPVIHVHTVVSEDGHDAMPHWRAWDAPLCRRGSAGAGTPEALEPRPGETVITKRFYSGFDNPDLDSTLKALNVHTLLLSGLYTHGCIRATALDAYSRGYETLVVSDAVASPDPIHSEASRQWMEGRCACFRPMDQIFGSSNDHDSAADVEAAIREAAAYVLDEASQHDWPDKLDAWLRQIQHEREYFIDLITQEVQKPLLNSQEEFERAVEHLRAAITLATESGPGWPGINVRHRPLGVIALLTPWNNPLAIPLAKASAALAFGNAVVWKPSPRAAAVAESLMNSYQRAGLPKQALQLVHGGPETARLIVTAEPVRAVSLTGSVSSGRSVAAMCAAGGKALQAELGGNNALIVLADADIEGIAPDLALAAFSYSGQRCTAIRRFIVERSVAETFEREMKRATESLPLGDPRDSATVIGPLIDAEQLEAIDQKVRQAISDGARLICGGARPNGWQHGAWYAPTLLYCADNTSRIVQEESFGPIAVIQIADDLEHALALCNGVAHGLVAGLVSERPDARTRFLGEAQAGILRFGTGPLAIHPEAPFGGWKASQFGPPEHGVWDRQFYTRPQAVYAED